VDHLEKYAQSTMNKHYHPWRILMNIGKESTEFGFWHETFLVQDGQYEGIYVHCPPFHFANALGTKIEPAQHGKRTMRGRLGKGSGEDKEWPEGYSKESAYCNCICSVIVSFSVMNLLTKFKITIFSRCFLSLIV